MSRTLRALAALSIFAVALSGCTKKNESPAPSELPAGATLMAEGDKAMSDVKSAHFTLTVDGTIDGLTVSKAEGDLTREGNAKGKATITQSGVKVEAEFVIVGQTAYIKGATGGFTPLPLAFAASVYDPSAILDPQRGAAKLLRTAKNPQTAGLEKVDGKDTYKVTFEPDTTAMAAVIPTKAAGVTAEVWLDKDTKKIAKAAFKIPGSPGGTITVTFSNYDVPVTISAP
ncbi:LppX_LprAFG lipoprotein [Catelliglobosispora koreensis]|uniref:LppX_LprAFG lipoprotein n=1 Tax=Catelliglobosispora koreensis TaxID=129052 RepID=UPI0003668DB8|nr:LppX_LprAFG lipoprotein [Catelliglobosispora koreensis]